MPEKGACESAQLLKQLNADFCIYMGLGQGAGLNLIWCIVLSRGSGTLAVLHVVIVVFIVAAMTLHIRTPVTATNTLEGW